MDAKDRRIAELEALVERLMRQVAELTAALEEERRKNKRQAAPFRKQDEPAKPPKKPGRKKGKRHGPHSHRAAIPPEKIDERYDVPLPTRCPHCESPKVEETRVVRTRTVYGRPAVSNGDSLPGDSPPVRHSRRRVPRLRPDRSTAARTANVQRRRAAKSQLGPRAHAAIAVLNKELGLSYGKVAKLFRELFGIRFARATGARSMARTARRGEQPYETIRQDVRGSPFVVPDETGWRVGGKNAWLHVFVGENAVCYDIGNRGGGIAERLLGRDYSGTMIHDGWAVYDRFTHAAHQQCVGHLQRRCRELLQTAKRDCIGPSSDGRTRSKHRRATRLPRKVLALIDRAFALRHVRTRTGYGRGAADG